MENRHDDELVINLVDLIFYLLKRWKSMLVLALICCLLGAGVGAVKGMQQDAQNAQLLQLEEEDYVPSEKLLLDMQQAANARKTLDKLLEIGVTGEEADLGFDMYGLNQVYSVVTNLEKTFQNQDMLYYQREFLGLDVEESTTETANTGNIVKTAVIGAVLGILLWGIWYVCVYLMNDSVKTEAEAVELCRVPLLGRLQTEGQTVKGIDKWVHDFYERTKRPAEDMPYLLSLIEEMDCGKVTLCGDRKLLEVAEIMAQVQQRRPSIQTEELVSVSANALSQAKANGQEILLVRIGKTRKAEVLRELEVGKLQGIKLLGLICVD